MFHGGTNFGLTSGANEAPYPDYQATVTSYDYDAPLDEAGDPTPKYFAFREVLGRYTPLPDLPIPGPAPKMGLGAVALTESAGLFASLEQLAAPIERATPEPMEYLGFDTGLILYRSWVDASGIRAPLTVRGLHDRAQIFIDGEPVGVLEREHHQETVEVEFPQGGAQLDILVENMGRVNYGPSLHDRKGINGGVLLGQQFLFGWQIYPLALDNHANLPFAPVDDNTGPAFYRGWFDVEQPLDTYLSLPGWTKGIVWVNGRCLGRYWKRGPQQDLFIPAPFMRNGQNELVVLELHGLEKTEVLFSDHRSV
jgi:beta-galactosidase